ncbi:MAG: AAA family ATPase [Ignavibacteriales bacterium]|nr:AAA family ATPase [Ignavibacteriales bacterium]
MKEVTINFGSGLNIITGETGAGKSIMLDALGLILGGRAYIESVRGGSSKSCG